MANFAVALVGLAVLNAGIRAENVDQQKSKHEFKLDNNVQDATVGYTEAQVIQPESVRRERFAPPTPPPSPPHWFQQRGGRVGVQKVTPTPEFPLIIEDDCMRDRRWWVFLASSFFTLIAGILIILIYRAITFISSAYKKAKYASQESQKQSALANSMPVPYDLLTGQSVLGANSGNFQKMSPLQYNQFDMNTGRQQLLYPQGQMYPQSSNLSQTNQQSQQVHASKADQLHHQRYHQTEQANQVGWMTEAKDKAGELISGQSAIGRILVILVFLLSIASLIIYFVDASRIGPNNGQYSEGVEKCQKWTESITQQIDLVLNTFFMIYFFIRFVAASDKLWFMLELYSFVDYFTIPPSFVSIYLDRTWIGLRAMRALRLMTIPDILQYLNMLKTSSSIRLSQLISIVVSVWLTAAGMIHLLENSGDLLDFSHPHSISYWECVYFLIVTMSTVGYGDIYCTTGLGRAFIVLFILIGLVSSIIGSV